MKINLDDHQTLDEISAFDDLIKRFTAEMKSKFRLKLQQGYIDWLNESDPELIANLLNNLCEHTAKGGQQMVDVAMLAAMLWNVGYHPNVKHPSER